MADLIQILLPRCGGVDDGAQDKEFAAVRAELVERFDGGDGISSRFGARGVDRAWWRDYAHTLAERFAQDEIHIRALTVETP